MKKMSPGTNRSPPKLELNPVGNSYVFRAQERACLILVEESEMGPS